MSAPPFMKFYCADWRGDPRLRMCSLAARGLWIDLMSYMHEGEPYGHMTIDGIAPDLHGIAALVARPAKEVLAALAELEERNVFSRTDASVIYSRRMVRDKAKAETDRANGKGGGNPKLRASDNGGVNPQDKAQILDTRNQKDKTADAGSADYAFVGGVIKLSARHYADWSDAYGFLDLRAELTARDAWLASAPEKDRKSWFISTSKYLANRNQEAKNKLAATRSSVPEGAIPGIT